MLIGIYIKNLELENNVRLQTMKKALADGGCRLYDIHTKEELRTGTDMVLSIGGDGTFLSASKRIADSGVPILGVNLGRLGFLSENSPEDVPAAVLSGNYELENRTMLKSDVEGSALPEDFWPYSLNEMTVHRNGAAVMGIKVTLDGYSLPTYWADGLLVATSSGSTAYSLSVGGPICSPDSKVLIVAPIAPHNLNVRPLIVPETTKVGISIITRDRTAVLTMDNRTIEIDSSTAISVSMAQFSLKRVRLPESNFVKALVSKLFWGEDIRNNDN